MSELPMSELPMSELPMPKLYSNKVEIAEAHQNSRWQSVVFKEFESTLRSDIRPFPCVFGVTGMQHDQLRFAFSENMEAKEIALPLKHFVHHSRHYGPNTSLVVFSRPQPVDSLKNYERRFWNLLQNLADLDEQEWPSDISLDVDSSSWEFCFAGEPMFVVCNTPAHVERQSRRSVSFTITFQPRWVFDKILSTAKSSSMARNTIRERLRNYDIAAPSKHLGSYGHPDAREFRQYFLLEDDQPTSCPFHSLTKMTKKVN